MAAVTAVPYRRAAPHRITGEPWQTVTLGMRSLLPPEITGLDYGSTLRLHRQIEIDVLGLRADCGLEQSAPLVAAASWFSPGTALRRSLCKAPIPPNAASCSIELTGEIAGGDIAGQVYIETSIFLAAPRNAGVPLTARRAGSVLRQEGQTVALDAATSYFPVEMMDFGKTSWVPPESGWTLSWNPFSLEQPFLGSVRLFVNAAHPLVAQAVSGDAPTREAAAIRAAIYFDVARTLVCGALASEDFIEADGSYAPGTCGGVVHSLIQMLFPGDALSGLSAAATQRPEHFSAELQAKLRLFWS